MDIRLLTPGDAHAYAELRREMLADSPWAFAAGLDTDVGVDPVAMAARLAEPGQAVLGAFDDASGRPRLVGVVGLVRHRHAKMAHRAMVWGVYVTPAHRGHGIGAGMLAALLETARTWPGVTSVALAVSEKSTVARRVYERIGFRAWGTEPGAVVLDGQSFDEIHMIHQLNE